MAGCKRCALKGEKGKGKKKRKEKEKGGKNGDQNRFFFIYIYEEVRLVRGDFAPPTLFWHLFQIPLAVLRIYTVSSEKGGLLYTWPR